jgi:hypothetical protein
MAVSGALLIALGIQNLAEDLLHIPVGELWFILVLLSYAAVLASALVCIGMAGTRSIGGCLMAVLIGDLLGENEAGFIVGTLGGVGLVIVTWQIATSGHIRRDQPT